MSSKIPVVEMAGPRRDLPQGGVARRARCRCVAQPVLACDGAEAAWSARARTSPTICGYTSAGK